MHAQVTSACTLTSHACYSLLQSARLDLGKALAEAQEAVQRHLLLVVIIRLQSSVACLELSFKCSEVPGNVFWVVHQSTNQELTSQKLLRGVM